MLSASRSIRARLPQVISRYSSEDFHWAPPSAESKPESGRKESKKPLLRPWFYNERAQHMPANGEFDHGTSQGDYFFGKPYFVHRNARDYYYEQIGFIDSEVEHVQCVILDIGVLEEDSFGNPNHLRGDVTWFPRDTAQRLMNDMLVWFAQPGWSQSIRERSLILDEEVTRKVYDDVSWLSSVELGIEFWPETGWKVTKETIARGLLKFSKVEIDIDCFEINEMSPIKEGEVEPSGLLIIDVNLQAIKLPTRSLSIPVKPKKELY